MNDVEEQLRAFYEGRQMPDERAEAILSEARELRPLRFRVSPRLLAAAAAVFCVVAGGLLTSILSPSRGVVPDLVDEMAVHHVEGKDPTVFSDSYDIVQSSLKRLPFSILPSRPSLLRDFELVGGRYCSLRGNPVAQIKLRDKEQAETHTLYVGSLPRALQNMKAETFYCDGVIVEIWTHDDRLFGLASDTR